MATISDVNHRLTISDIPDIQREVNTIKHYSAVGHDKFLATILKMCRCQIAGSVIELWRSPLDPGYIPYNFLSQSVVPVFKRENKSHAMIYRSISLASHIIKVSEKTTICWTQSACFPWGQRLIVAVFAPFNDILKVLREGSNIDGIFLDFSRAFQILLKKLSNNAICGKPLQ